MIEAIKRLLRGRHNSIRYKYGVLPREWLTYLFKYRLRGKSWVDFYAQRLDGFAEATVETLPSEQYLAVGAAHFEYLRKKGLRSEHRFLDFGCGVMRLGAFVAKFLDTGNYTGVDISANRLKKGRKVMDAAGIPENVYQSICVADCELRELSSRQFDIVWAQSVLTHMPEADIRMMLRSIKPLMSDGAAFYFTFAPAKERRRANIKDFWYPEGEIRRICEYYGYVFTIENDWPGVGDAMAKLTCSAR